MAIVDNIGLTWKSSCDEVLPNDARKIRPDADNFFLGFFPYISDGWINYIKNGQAFRERPMFNFETGSNGDFFKCIIQPDGFPLAVYFNSNGQQSSFGNGSFYTNTNIESLRNTIDEKYVKGSVTIPIMAESLVNSTNTFLSIKKYPKEQKSIELNTIANIDIAAGLLYRQIYSIYLPYFIKDFDSIINGEYLSRTDCKGYTIADYYYFGKNYMPIRFVMRFMMMAYNEPFDIVEYYLGYPVNLLYQDFDYNTCKVRDGVIWERNYKDLAGMLRNLEKQGIIKRDLSIFTAVRPANAATGNRGTDFYSTLQVDKDKFTRQIKPTAEQLNRYYSKWKPPVKNMVVNAIKSNIGYIALIFGILIFVYLIFRKK